MRSGQYRQSASCSESATGPWGTGLCLALSPPTDEDYVPAPLADAAAWLTEHGDALYAFAMRELRDSHAAEEAVQETLLAALTAERTFERRSSPSTWLVGILRHKIVDQVRRTKRARTDRSRFFNADQELDQGSAVQFKSGRWAQQPRRWSARAGSPAEDEEFRRALSRCLDKLPERSSHAVRLLEQQQLSVGQASKILSITPTNLSVILYRARLALRDCLERTWLKTKD